MLKLKTVIVAESDDTRPIEQLSRGLRNANDIMPIKFRCGVPQGATTPYKFEEATMKTDKISRVITQH